MFDLFVALRWPDFVQRHQELGKNVLFFGLVSVRDNGNTFYTGGDVARINERNHVLSDTTMGSAVKSKSMYKEEKTKYSYS